MYKIPGDYSAIIHPVFVTSLILQHVVIPFVIAAWYINLHVYLALSVHLLFELCDNPPIFGDRFEKWCGDAGPVGPDMPPLGTYKTKFES